MQQAVHMPCTWQGCIHARLFCAQNRRGCTIFVSQEEVIRYPSLVHSWCTFDHETPTPPLRPPVGGPHNGPGTGSDPYAHLRTLPAADPLEIQRLWQEQQLLARHMVLQQQSVAAR